jgi:hypothetical protein
MMMMMRAGWVGGDGGIQRWCASWWLSGGEVLLVCLSVRFVVVLLLLPLPPSGGAVLFSLQPLAVSFLFCGLPPVFFFSLCLLFFHAVAPCSSCEVLCRRVALRAKVPPWAWRQFAVCRRRVPSACCSPQGDQLSMFFVAACHIADGTFPTSLA